MLQLQHKLYMHVETTVCRLALHTSFVILNYLAKGRNTSDWTQIKSAWPGPWHIWFSWKVL